jgi:C4-dicarboxylate transporter
MVLLVMAGFIGTLGAKLSLPLMDGANLDLAALPAWLILLAIVWIIPLTGLMGMNPILSVSLMAPLLPNAEAMGIAPAAIIVAITSGWALGGASSPYTATTLLVGSIGGVSAWRVGVSWNGLYTLLCGLLLSGWVVVVSRL